MKKLFILFSLLLTTIGCTQKKYSLLLSVDSERVIDGKEILAASDKAAVMNAIKCLDDCLATMQDAGTINKKSYIIYNLKREKDGEIVWGYLNGKKYGEVESLFVYEPKLFSKKQSSDNKEEIVAYKDAKFGMKRQEVKALPYFNGFYSFDANGDTYKFNLLGQDDELIGGENCQVWMGFDTEQDELFYVIIYSPIFESLHSARLSLVRIRDVFEEEYGAPKIYDGDIDAEYRWTIGNKVIKITIEKGNREGYHAQALIADLDRFSEYWDLSMLL